MALLFLIRAGRTLADEASSMVVGLSGVGPSFGTTDRDSREGELHVWSTEARGVVALLTGRSAQCQREQLVWVGQPAHEL
jgi:hypothetical protein